jgi:predicted dehydrogenase
MMLRIAVIGVGWAGTRQIEAVRELRKKVKIECIVDNDRKFLKRKSEELKIPKFYTDVKDALIDPKVEAVSICTPHKLHCKIAVASAKAGKHILCEKPIAFTVNEATRMIKAAKENNVKLYVAENAVYSRMAKFLKRIVHNRTYIGEPAFVTLITGFQALRYGYPGRRKWLSTPKLGGTGSWMLHGIHTVAQMRYILGEVRTVYINEHHISSFHRTDIEGTMSGLLTLENGVNVLLVQTSETKIHKDLGKYIIYGDKGVLRASAEKSELFRKNKKTLLLQYPKEKLSAHAQEIEAFADYVANISEGPTTGTSERRSLAIIQAGYKSAETGKPINLKVCFGKL